MEVTMRNDMDAILDSIEMYAREHEESPIRAAYFFLCEDAWAARQLTGEKADEIYFYVCELGVSGCVEICRNHGARI
jgi:hypothetical protein